MDGLRLLVLYVTVEQDTSVQCLFEDHNWKFENKAQHLFEAIRNGEVHVKPDSSSFIERFLKIENDDTPDTHLYIPPNARETERIDSQSDNESVGEEVQNGEKPQQKWKLRSRRSSKTLTSVTVKKQKSVKEKICKPRSKRKRNISKQTNIDKNILHVNNQLVEDDDKDNAISNKKKVYKCSRCSYSSPLKSNYTRHIRVVHVSTRHKCSHCNKSYKSALEAKMHELLAHVTSLKCDECDKQFTSRAGLVNHRKQVHLKKNLYTCDICQAAFYYKQHYQGHLNRHKNQKPFSCSKCDKPFGYKTSLNMHEKTCKGEPYYKTHNIDGTIKTEKKQKIMCEMCGDSLSSKSSLKMHHKLLHTDTPKSECSICGKQFKSVHSLTRHHRVIHTDNKNASHPCEICGRVFNQVTVLRQHVKRHKQEFSAFCGTCGKGFYSNYKMKEHERIHTGEKPFSCTVCTNFTCSTKNNLLKHMRLHDKDKKPGQRKKPASDPPAADDSDVVVILNDQSSAPLNEDKRDMVKLQPVTFEPLVVYKTGEGYPQVMERNGEIIASDNSGNLGNGSEMTMTNEIGRYNYEHYGEESVIPVQDGVYDPRMHGDGYYGSMGMTTHSDQVPQGLNILTVAMNMVNPGTY